MEGARERLQAMRQGGAQGTRIDPSFGQQTWVLDLKDKETLFMQVTPRQLLDHLQSICGGLHAIDVLKLQNEMQEYHTDREVILEYINALEAAQKKYK